MARSGPASRNQLHVGRYFGALLTLLAILYSIVWFGGDDGPLTPKLGLDLRGGASVVLQVQQEAGGPAPTSDQLDTAIDIIQRRVNGLGVAEAEVVTQGSNIVVSVPGGTRESLKALTVTAQLRFREVLDQQAGGGPAPETPVVVPSGSAAPTGSAAPSAAPSAAAPSAGPTATTNGRALSRGLVAVTPTPTPTASGAAPSGTPTASATPTPTASGAAYAGPKSGDVYTPQAFAALDCSQPGAREGGSLDKPEQQIISCSDDGAVKYFLDKAPVVGTDVKGATASLDSQTGTQWQIIVSFTGSGQRKFTDLTVKTVGKPVAIVLDGLVLSAPTIQDRIDGEAQITGDFTRKTSAELANTLKYGALPLSFKTGQVEVVSATLGDDQLKSGLIAGGIGLAVVVVYALLYYRILGLVTVLGLSVAGSIVYAAVTILGDQIGFALSLAGIAGFIVAVGITADSFVVYFERLKDEVRSGKSPRSAADRAWVRARRTILSANSVSFIGALTLYFVSVGSVRGFAFTLGLSTLIDVIVVFLFTRPLVSFLSRYSWFTNEKLSGLARPRSAEDPTPGKPGPIAPQEA